MKEFLNTIYSYEYFGFYLLISIVLLVVLFLIILFFGKKDQKNREIEATKKLQQINEDTFKEDSIEEKVEINNLEDIIVVPKIDEVPTLNYVEDTEEIPEPILPIMENVVEEKESISHATYEPVLEKIEEKPLVFDNTNVFNNDFATEVKNTQSEKENFETFKINGQKSEEIKVPEFNLENIINDVDEIKSYEMPINSQTVFSSVYVPEKEEKLEIPVEKAMEDLEFELPSLKKEEKIEQMDVPILKDYNLDELSGETYNIKK